jgi:hypothetical protein
MSDASLMEAYAELRALLANPNTPEGVVSAEWPRVIVLVHDTTSDGASQ